MLLDRIHGFGNRAVVCGHDIERMEPIIYERPRLSGLQKVFMRGGLEEFGKRLTDLLHFEF